MSKMYAVLDSQSGKIAYRYGEPWVMMQLFIDGGFSTKEEAMEAWEREQEAFAKRDEHVLLNRNRADLEEYNGSV